MVKKTHCLLAAACCFVGLSAPLLADDHAPLGSGLYVPPGAFVTPDVGSTISGWHGVHLENGTLFLNESAITATGEDGAAGVFGDRYSSFSLNNVEIKTEQAGSTGLLLREGSYGYLVDGAIDAKGHGAVLQQGGNQLWLANTRINADGAGLYFQGDESDYTNVYLTDSVMTAKQSAAILAEGANHGLYIDNSAVQGDTLAQATNGADGIGSDIYINANNSHLFGRTAVADESTLGIALNQDSEWTLRPSADGKTVSRVTFLDLRDDTKVIFTPIHPNPDYRNAPYQTLVVGAGNRHGADDVYNANPPVIDLIPMSDDWQGNLPPCQTDDCSDAGSSGQARIRMNTWLNAGGSLANQYTDRLIINGDVRGITLMEVVPVVGSVGAETGDTARDGISLVQVYGNAASDSFVLDGEYVAVGPYQYHLRAFDPDASDPNQRNVHGVGDKFWDYRLQSQFSGSGFGRPEDPDVVPQLPSYLAAPTAIFQARLFDIDTWHRRLGDDRHATNAASQNPKRERDVFLRTYGGKYVYRAQPGSSHYISDTRYNAVQMGGNLITKNAPDATWRVGLAGSYGTLSFQPRNIDGNRKTRIKAWSVSPTATWQHTLGGYVDALFAWGGFKGDVHTRQRGKTATLGGKSLAASIEAGLPFYAGGLTLLPQVQAVYQRLKFDRTRDADGIVVALGSISQWMLRTGGEIRASFDTAAGNTLQVYSKVHVAHTLGDGKKVRLAQQDFHVGKSGTVLEAGLGFDATFGKTGNSVLYADLTRQCRISRAGHQGWTANLGVRVNF